MLTNIRWPDNIGTVGWTCITASLDPQEMDWLLLKCPKGSFTACFPHKGVINNRAQYEVHLAREGNREAVYLRTFYFSFPLDVFGLNLLKELCFLNPDERLPRR
jgi:hypothetical protein